jgi:hypothetical protein
VDSRLGTFIAMRALARPPPEVVCSVVSVERKSSAAAT